jgi:hypothetical protein
MSARKTRLTVTVDAPLLREGREAVKAGRAESLSAWVNAALVAHSADEKRRRALTEFLADYERRHGKITDEMVQAQERKDRANAIVVRGRRSRRPAA